MQTLTLILPSFFLSVSFAFSILFSFIHPSSFLFSVFFLSHFLSFLLSSIHRSFIFLLSVPLPPFPPFFLPCKQCTFSSSGLLVLFPTLCHALCHAHLRLNAPFLDTKKLFLPSLLLYHCSCFQTFIKQLSRVQLSNSPPGIPLHRNFFRPWHLTATFCSAPGHLTVLGALAYKVSGNVDFFCSRLLGICQKSSRPPGICARNIC